MIPFPFTSHTFFVLNCRFGGITRKEKELSFFFLLPLLFFFVRLWLKETTRLVAQVER